MTDRETSGQRKQLTRYNEDSFYRNLIEIILFIVFTVRKSVDEKFNNNEPVTSNSC